jgi:hypothetical protein
LRLLLVVVVVLLLLLSTVRLASKQKDYRPRLGLPSLPVPLAFEHHQPVLTLWVLVLAICAAASSLAICGQLRDPHPQPLQNHIFLDVEPLFCCAGSWTW